MALARRIIAPWILLFGFASALPARAVAGPPGLTSCGLASGVEVARVDASHWSIGVRGFGEPFSKSLIFVDGRKIYTPLFAGTYWPAYDLPLEEINATRDHRRRRRRAGERGVRDRAAYV